MPPAKSTASPSRPGKACQNCRAVENPPDFVFRYCGLCHRTAYCNRDCQRADWKMHKFSCASAAEKIKLMKGPLRYLPPPGGTVGPVIDRKVVERKLMHWIEAYKPLLKYTVDNALTLQTTPERCNTEMVHMWLKTTPQKDTLRYFSVEKAMVRSFWETRVMVSEREGVRESNAVFDSLAEMSKAMHLQGSLGLGVIVTFIEEARIMHMTPFGTPQRSEAINRIDSDWLANLTDMVAAGVTGR
ncbi:hypothetical protein FIBSPDRAFT_868068 [Athelia psychrophila]|uniref:MYND-type domain-containing protein n=1 Tax=Athelia psychrophila TaxID=1759441 RepID=A0A166DGJ4_9AGAM|nr:hypothetical protein FIBSPDRAFT_868068 [Fibularhizoctonia sp. CBS 109695]